MAAVAGAYVSDPSADSGGPRAELIKWFQLRSAEDD